LEKSQKDGFLGKVFEIIKKKIYFILGTRYLFLPFEPL